MYNHCQMMGRIVNDPELKVTPNGIAVCSFRIAVERRYHAKNEERKTDFFNVVAWRKLGEFVTKYFPKGRMIFVGGELQTKQYTDKHGNPATWYEIIADRIEFTGDRGKTEQSEAPAIPETPAISDTQPESSHEAQQETPPFGEPPDADDYPF